MDIEVDQSGKIERLNHHTIIAMSNEVQYCVKIPKQLKRKIIVENRNVKQIKYKLFCIGIYYCLRRYIASHTVIIIDDEYHGANKMIKSVLLSYFKRDNKYFDSDLIKFGTIGKKSKAHYLAIETFRREHNPNEILTERQILKLLK